MKTRLEILVEDPNFRTDYINFDTGLMVHPSGEVLNFIWLEYEEYFHVYLNLYNLEEPFQEIMADAIGRTLQDAKDKAIENFDKLFYVH